MAASVVITVAVIGVGRYDQSTKIDRSTPTIAVTQLVSAMFASRDEATVARFSCREPRLQPLRDLAADLKDRERRFGTHFGVTVSDMRLMGSSTVEVELGLSAAGTKDVQLWVFEMVDEGGWRVCAARPS